MKSKKIDFLGAFRQIELVNSLKKYNLKTFLSDLTAGVIVGIVALPLAIAFAIASGVEPSRGLFTAIVAGFLISLLGGSKVQIGGPTGAFVVIVYGVIQKYGYDGLVVATIMAGILLILMGAFKLGGLVKFIPYTIITGFTAGIAVTIAAGQIGDFLGLTTGKMPGDFIGKMKVYATCITTINWWAFGMAAICLVIVFLWPKVPKVGQKIPGSLIVIILATLVAFFAKLPVETIGSRYGQIPTRIPSPSFPKISLDMIVELFPTSVSIAVLAAIESLLSAVVADGMIGSKHNSNVELVAQGIANIASPIFGGIPATGAIARTATNIKNGGKTPVAGIIHAITLLLIMLFLGKFVVFIPMAALSAVLINVAWNMAGFPAIKALFKGQKSDITVFLVTFLITIFIDLTVAIAVGLILAAFFFIKKMIDVSEVREERSSIVGGVGEGIVDSNGKRFNDVDEEELSIPKDTLVYEIDGPLFFGTVRKFEVAVEQAEIQYKVLILRMRNTLYLDAGGIRALEQLKNACDRKKVTIVLSGIHAQPYMILQKCGMAQKIGEENIFDHIDKALAHAKKLVGEA